VLKLMLRGREPDPLGRGWGGAVGNTVMAGGIFNDVADVWCEINTSEVCNRSRARFYVPGGRTGLSKPIASVCLRLRQYVDDRRSVARDERCPRLMVPWTEVDMELLVNSEFEALHKDVVLPAARVRIVVGLNPIRGMCAVIRRARFDPDVDRRVSAEGFSRQANTSRAVLCFAPA
jgi:hypothetical protein